MNRRRPGVLERIAARVQEIQAERRYRELEPFRQALREAFRDSRGRTLFDRRPAVPRPPGSHRLRSR